MKIPPNKNNKVIFGTVSWIKQDTYKTEDIPISRWSAVKAFLKGKIHIKYQVPVNQKRKAIYFKGKKV